ncbi:DUF6984 family protein [Duganella aceris]|uniref:DUF6984 domain-containing protein n=1 Tax=Duganella aceris TaxID=2703883 RepID=A0ABX0FG64_9BURK|nr:hypothetical protein [Duganella aceris]NGZ83525.1 hypothetical protein [Duganella aceris]
MKEIFMPLGSQARPRSLRAEEKTLIQSMLQTCKDSAALMRQLDIAMVEDMLDGGMGSLRFSSDETRSLGAAVADADYIDTDGVPVSIAVNVDQKGNCLNLIFGRPISFPWNAILPPRK